MPICTYFVCPYCSISRLLHCSWPLQWNGLQYPAPVFLIISFIVATHCLSEICDLLLVSYPLLQFVTYFIGIIAGIVPICIFTQTLYRIGGIFRRENFSQISRFRKNYTQKTKFYMVHTLFLTDSQKFNPAKYTTYTVYTGHMVH